MTYRARWAEVWEDVRYCSARCRRNRPSDVDRRLESAIEALLARRARGATLCPSEAARHVSPDGWRRLRGRVRSAARRLEARGIVEIRQEGRRVDPSTAKGPIRVGRGRNWAGWADSDDG